MKKTLLNSPEYYLVILIILSGYTPPFSFNPIFIGLTAIVMLQIIFKNKISGIIIGSSFLLINLFMLGALISEFREFATFNSQAKQLLFVGLPLWALNMTASIIIIYKYLKGNSAYHKNAIDKLELK